MTSIVEFLTARYDEIEHVAKAAPPGDWELSDRGWQLRLTADAPAFERIATVEQPTREQLLAFNHIALHDPAYVLADIAAKRKILALHEEKSHRECRLCEPHDPEWPCRTVRLFAAPFVEHPDFQPEWNVVPT